MIDGLRQQAVASPLLGRVGDAYHTIAVGPYRVGIELKEGRSLFVLQRTSALETTEPSQTHTEGNLARVSLAAVDRMLGIDVLAQTESLLL